MQTLHYLQLQNSGRFCQYDYGTKENLKRYGSKIPPDYPIGNITTPIALVYSLNDNLVNIKDVQHLAKILPNVVYDRMLPYKSWNHATMFLNDNSIELVHIDLIKNMKKFENL